MDSVQALIDRNEVADLVARLERWLDGHGGDPTTIYDEDVIVRSPRGEFRGLDEVVGVIQGGDDIGERAQHFSTDVLVELDGDAAVVHANQLVQFFHPESPPHRTSGLRLEYKMARRPNGWRMVQADITLEWLIGTMPQ